MQHADQDLNGEGGEREGVESGEGRVEWEGGEAALLRVHSIANVAAAQALSWGQFARRVRGLWQE
jgi:hypothetical protein